MRLNHVALTVSDRERSADFYGRYFGMTQRLHDDDHLLILANEQGCLLALSSEEAPVTELPRTTHFGFQCETVEAVHQARLRFQEDGVPEAEWQPHGPTRIQVFDPDGYRVEQYAF